MEKMRDLIIKHSLNTNCSWIRSLFSHKTVSNTRTSIRLVVTVYRPTTYSLPFHVRSFRSDLPERRLSPADCRWASSYPPPSPQIEQPPSLPPKRRSWLQFVGQRRLRWWCDVDGVDCQARRCRHLANTFTVPTNIVTGFETFAVRKEIEAIIGYL